RDPRLKTEDNTGTDKTTGTQDAVRSKNVIFRPRAWITARERRDGRDVMFWCARIRPRARTFREAQRVGASENFREFPIGGCRLNYGFQANRWPELRLERFSSRVSLN